MYLYPRVNLAFLSIILRWAISQATLSTAIHAIGAYPKRTVHVVPSGSRHDPPGEVPPFPSHNYVLQQGEMGPIFSCLTLSAPPEPSVRFMVFRLTLGVRVIFAFTNKVAHVIETVQQIDSEVVYRALVALGEMVTPPNSSTLRC